MLHIYIYPCLYIYVYMYNIVCIYIYIGQSYTYNIVYICIYIGRPFQCRALETSRTQFLLNLCVRVCVRRGGVYVYIIYIYIYRTSLLVACPRNLANLFPLESVYMCIDIYI